MKTWIIVSVIHGECGCPEFIEHAGLTERWSWMFEMAPSSSLGRCDPAVDGQTRQGGCGRVMMIGCLPPPYCRLQQQLVVCFWSEPFLFLVVSRDGSYLSIPPDGKIAYFLTILLIKWYVEKALFSPTT